MDNSSLLTVLSVIVSAIITSAATVLAAYISKGRAKRVNAAKGTVLTLPGYATPHPRVLFFSNKWTFAAIILSLISLALATRWLLGGYASNSTRMEMLAFASKNDPAALNTGIKWEAGSSESSTYSLRGNALIMIAGPYTWPNFPMIYYERPITGDFDAQVTVEFIPEAERITTAQMVGMLARPANTRLVQGDTSFPRDWVAAARNITDAGSLIGCRGSWDDFSANTFHLRLERAASAWRCAYSDNGENWTWLDVSGDSSQLGVQELVVSLFAYSMTERSITAEFSDWMISENGP